MYGTLSPLAKQNKQVDPNIEFVGFSNAFAQQLIGLGSESIEGVVFPIIFFPGSSDPAVQAFVGEYNKEYGSDPSSLTAQAYDSVGILLSAVEKAGSTDKNAIKKAMYETEYPGVSGHTVFDANGDAQKTFTAATVQGGKFVEIKR